MSVLDNAIPARWEFRQFILSDTTHMLFESPLHKIFQDKYNAQVDNEDVRAMVLVNANRSGINKDQYDIPDVDTGASGTGRILPQVPHISWIHQSVTHQ